MKVKIKTKNKKVKRWLEQHDGKNLQSLILREAEDLDYDHLDWLKQVLDESKVDKSIIAWLFNRPNPVEGVVDALKEAYMKECVSNALSGGKLST